MGINSKPYRAEPSSKVDLKQWHTLVEPVYNSKDNYKKILDEYVSELSALQQLLYASNSCSILLILQAMDSAGKDGIIKHVMSGVNPQGCKVTSFKHPNNTELKHDFLWRAVVELPERGKIGIFNRSYYEEVLIARVHPEILKAESLSTLAQGEKIWDERYASINNFEAHLGMNGTVIIKIFLHLSKDEQRKRFLERIDKPEKNWKFSEADITERAFWKQYQDVYEKCIEATSTQNAPWYVIPADDKQNARLIVSDILVETLRSLKMSYPLSTEKRRKELQAIRQQLEK